MKEKEGYVDYPEQQMILYVEKEDGKYGPMQTGSYLSAHYMEDYVLKRKNLEKSLRDELTGGLISPVRYYMVLEELTVAELAARAGIRKSRVRKHSDAKGFLSATVAELAKYARVFNVPPANLLQVVLIRNKGDFEPNLLLENRAEHLSVVHESTANAGVVLTKIEERR